MNRSYYLNLAHAGARMAIATHLVLHKYADHEAIVLDGARLGDVIVEAARHFKSSLAVPVMDLTLEKEALLSAHGVPAAQIDAYHFSEDPGADWPVPLTPRQMATCAALTHVNTESERDGGFIATGMGIGPFSLMTKLIADPITPVFLAGSGVTTGEDADVALMERALQLALNAILPYVEAQCKAGAKAFIMCEPAANMVYFSPNQLAESYDVFERYVMGPCRRVKAVLDKYGVGLVFHDCGELQDEMVRRFATLEPMILSFGSSRKLWEDAALVPENIVLFGNLPSKKFYSDALITLEQVKEQANDLLGKMKATGHPFILGSECDILSVPGAEATIMEKVMGFLNA